MKKFKFTAQIEVLGGGAFVFFPYDVEKEFGTRGRVPVQATFDGAAYRGSLVNYGHPQHMLGLLKAIREQIGKGPGDMVKVEVWRDGETRTVEIPPLLLDAIKQHRLLTFFEELSYTHRKEYCRYISEAKKEETRSRRIAKAVELLKKGVRTPDGN